MRRLNADRSNGAERKRIPGWLPAAVWTVNCGLAHAQRTAELPRVVYFAGATISQERMNAFHRGLTELAAAGGFYHPHERLAEKILGDVRSGYVSVDAARRDYDVAIRQLERRYELDVDETTRLRQSH